ncbi:hypothetical protein [Daejeonella lutea]|uniref:Uncharacterized protein n=1 Tax=Daejeonella lutea TaxID=572036 RepID=A0A1T5ET32_9SPHI|nr:hypothetical protein [Daejeonella lutea]SKB87115.1 hypothetical protein SAMN05661099_3194 [Daejeonella lutea]
MYNIAESASPTKSLAWKRIANSEGSQQYFLLYHNNSAPGRFKQPPFSEKSLFIGIARKTDCP